ncbi:helix-turn-helix domain-containing protein [Agrobacterium larrymoorei]|uniref:helix-turn-helix domain-containing protein n=1 Tax=Agrobacterium larrymoorei TaxID=160699 RepID=UPI0030C2CEB9
MDKAQKKSKPEGIFIEELMEANKLKNKDVAEKMGTTDATISRLLNGQRGIDLDWLHKFAKALDVPLWKLFRRPGSDEPTSPEAALRSAMIAYGVDRSQLGRAVQIVATFRTTQAAEEQSEQSQSDDQSQHANPRHEVVPSR